MIMNLSQHKSISQQEHHLAGGVPVEVRNIHTDDNVRLAISRIKPRNGQPISAPVILVHGSYSTRRFWVSDKGIGLGVYLADQGFERDGSNWVRFDVPVPGAEEFITLEKEISRRVKVIQASADGAERRVVVELQFSIGDHQQVAEFTLADRSNLTYQALIGRNVLRDVMLIDVGKEYATELPESIRNDNDNGKK